MAKRLSKKIYIKTRKKIILCCLIFIISLILLNYLLINTKLLSTNIDSVKVNYISFNNFNTTDMLKISNIEKQNPRHARSIFNKNNITLNIKGPTNYKYKIVLYNEGVKVNDKYIKYYLVDKNNKVVASNSLDKCNIKDGGRVIYNGTIKKNNKYNLKLYSKINKKNVSYEVKIKPR